MCMCVALGCRAGFGLGSWRHTFMFSLLLVHIRMSLPRSGEMKLCPHIYPVLHKKHPRFMSWESIPNILLQNHEYVIL